jgi:hypothetical protein
MREETRIMRIKRISTKKAKKGRGDFQIIISMSSIFKIIIIN